MNISGKVKRTRDQRHGSIRWSWPDAEITVYPPRRPGGPWEVACWSLEGGPSILTYLDDGRDADDPDPEMCAGLRRIVEWGYGPTVWEHARAAAAAGVPMETRPSIPEPPPVPGRAEVAPALCAWLCAAYAGAGLEDSGSFQDALSLVEARAAYGRAKYGTALQTHNGRNPLEDALQELGDLLMYVQQAKMESRDLAPIRRLLPVLEALVREEG